MNSAIIVMTLLGCGQTDAACDYIRTVDTTFTSRIECEAHMDAELLKTGSDGYPNVIAVCEPASASVAAVPDLPGPGKPELAEISEPKVIMAPPEAEPKRPLKKMAEKTRKFVGGVGDRLRSAWQGLTKRKPQRQGREEPVLLGEYNESES